MGIDVRSSNTITVEHRSERHRPRLASRRAGNGAHRDVEHVKLGPDIIGGVMVASAASHIRRCHARVSQQNSRGKAAFIFVPYHAYVVGTCFFPRDLCFLEYTYVRVYTGNIFSLTRVTFRL